MHRKILIVDEEKNIVESLKSSLEHDGYQVFGFTSAGDALRFFNDHPVDIAISEIHLPDMEGTEIFQEFRKMNPFIQVVFMTDKPTLENLTQTLETGVADFIIKPFSYESVLVVVSEISGKIKRWRNLRKEMLHHRDTALGI